MIYGKGEVSVGEQWTYGGGTVVTYPSSGTLYQVPVGHHRQHKGLITTNAVKAKRGWLGQVSVDQKIVWESEPMSKREDALELADDRIAMALGRLFDDG